MKKVHRLISKQAQKFFGGVDFIPDEIKSFVEAVNSTYMQYDEYREVMERALDLSSYELIEANEELNKHQEHLSKLVEDRTTELKIANKQLKEENKQRIKSEIILRGLYKITQASYEAETLHDMLISIQKILGTFMDTTNFFIALYDKETGLLSLPYFVDNRDEFDTFPVGKTLTGFVIRNNKPMLVNKNDILKLIEQGEIEQVGTLAEVWLGVPMKAGGDVNGAVVVQSYVNNDAFSQRELEILKFVANQIGSLVERKKSEEALKDSEKRNRVLIESMNEGVGILDERGFIKFTNQSFLEMVGYSKEEIWGKSASEILDEKSSKIFEKELFEKREVREVPHEMCLIKKNGEKLHTLVSPRAIYTEAGNYTGSFAIFTDITERKKAEEAIKKYNNELKELNSNKDKFFSILAHDLRSPFVTLLGFTEILSEETGELSEEEVKFFASNIHESATGLFSLLENLLEWSRVQTGRIQFKPETIALNEIIFNIAELFAENAQRKEILLNIKSAKHFEVNADKNMIESVLRNLISNAIKFTPHKGKIDIIAEQNNGSVYVKVSDTGRGISESEIKKLFRIDQHVTTEGTDNEKGTGLGLILCKEFVNKHGGDIWVESTESKGSNFIFTLPAISRN